MAILQHRDYFQIAESNLENIRNDIWDVEFTRFPSAIYNPGLDLIKRRLTTLDPGVETQPALIDKQVLGHNILSPGGRNGGSVDITFTFNDREDQAISYMIQDYLNQTADPDTGFGRHKTELLMEFDLIFYNTLLKQVRKISYYAAIYSACFLPRQVGEHGGDNSNPTLTVKCEHHKVFFL